MLGPLGGTSVFASSMFLQVTLTHAHSGNPSKLTQTWAESFLWCVVSTLSRMSRWLLMSLQKKSHCPWGPDRDDPTSVTVVIGNMVPTPSITHLGVAVPLGHWCVTLLSLSIFYWMTWRGQTTVPQEQPRPCQQLKDRRPLGPPWATQLTWGEAALGCLLSNALPSYSSFWKTMLPNPVSQRWPHPPKVNEALLPAVTLPWLLRHELVI